MAQAQTGRAQCPLFLTDYRQLKQLSSQSSLALKIQKTFKILAASLKPFVGHVHGYIHNGILLETQTSTALPACKLLIIIHNVQ